MNGNGKLGPGGVKGHLGVFLGFNDPLHSPVVEKSREIYQIGGKKSNQIESIKSHFITTQTNKAKQR